MSYRKGITLIELLIAIGIAAILVVVAAPSFNQLLKKYRLSTASNNLYYQLQLAKSEALKRNATIFITFNTGSSWCYGISSGSACSCSSPSTCTLGSTQASSSAISLSLTGLSGNTLSFEPIHGAANASTTITFTDANDAGTYSRVIVSRFGNMQTCQSGGSSAC